MLLLNKVAVVTGAGTGVGSAIAKLFAAHGAFVALHYRNSKKSAELLAAEIGTNALAFQADLTDMASTQTFIDGVMLRFGRIDVLVNNASGFTPGKNFELANFGDFALEFVNVLAPTINPCKSVVPIMKTQGTGKIINFGATLVQRPAVDQIVHTTAKSALLGFTRGLAKELGPYGITVNLISPGMTLTKYTETLPEALKSKVASETPLGRLATPEDVAHVALFYASNLSDFVTSANISPDGGLVYL